MDPSFLILIGFFALMWFILIRPQQKRQREHQRMIGELAVGDDVVTIGGLHGTVAALHPDAVDLEVTDDIVLRFQRSAIAKVVPLETAVADPGDGSSTLDP